MNKESCYNCGMHLKPHEQNYWKGKLLCDGCWDLEYVETKHGMGFKI